jgi:PBP1b-binding outer membrane lipoprotein LpoB
MTKLSAKRIGSVVAVAAMFVGGCASTPDRVMRQNYTQIRENASTRAEVGSLLGTPEHTIGDTWMYTRPEQHLTVIIDFGANGEVVRKQWVDGETGTWDDSSDQQ